MKHANSARRSFALITIVAAAASSSCALLTHANDYDVEPPKSTLCEACPGVLGVRLPPCAPDDGSAALGDDRVYAVRRVSFGAPDEYRGAAAASFDRSFDMNCSAGSLPRSRCVVADPEGWETLPGGVDDAWLTRVLAPVYDTSKKHQKKLDLDASLSQEHEKGKLGLVAVLHDYNGMANDPDVALSLHPSPGTKGNPKWDGADVWPESGPLDASPYLSLRRARGYVSGGVLVIDQRDRGQQLLRVRRGKSSLDLLVGDLFLTARIEGSSLVRLTLSGALDLAETFASAGDILAVLSVCKGPLRDEIEAGLPRWVSNAADLPARSARSPEDPCGAISFSIAFDAEPAVLGGVEPAHGNNGVSESCEG